MKNTLCVKVDPERIPLQDLLRQQFKPLVKSEWPPGAFPQHYGCLLRFPDVGFCCRYALCEQIDKLSSLHWGPSFAPPPE